jgi:hypothetical protein
MTVLPRKMGHARDYTPMWTSRADPNHPVSYRRGDTAEAEPAVPGWRVAVDWIFS